MLSNIKLSNSFFAQNNLNIKKKISTKSLKSFVSNIYEKEFRNEKNVNNSPWKYFNDKNVKFFFLLYKNKTIGVLVNVETNWNKHLYFFYIIKKFRNKGLGRYLINKFFLNTKKFKTIHVPKNLLSTIKFYKKFNMCIAKGEHREKTKKWIKRCLNFGSEGSLQADQRYLFIEKKYQGRGNKNSLGNVLFFGRDKCLLTLKVLKYLKRKSKKVYFYRSKKIGEILNIKKNHLKCDYIFCFRSYFILREEHINAPTYKAINFHPGPPEYRGSGPVNFSIYNKEKKFGCTAHIMNRKIDNGQILDVKRFKVKKNEGVKEVLEKTYKCLFTQAKNIINQLYQSPNNLEKMIAKSKKEKWSKFSKKIKDLNKFYQLSLKSSKKELERKILSTKYLNFKPYIIFKSKKFILDE